MRGLIHVAAALGVAAIAVAAGRWLRDPQPGGPLLVLAAAALVCALALRRLYRPGSGGPFRSVGDLVRVAGFGPSRVRGLGNRVRAG